MKLFGTKSHAHEHLAKCERKHGEAIAALANADAALIRAGAAYDASLDQGRDAAVAARRARGDAEVDRDIARSAVTSTASLLDAARIAVGAAETERLASAAATRIREFESAATRDLKAMASLARNLAQLYANAEAARDDALRGGVKESDLPPVEAFRGVPGLPRQEVETKRVERWIHPYTREPLSDEQSARVRMTGSDAYLTDSGTPMRLWDKDLFDRIVVLNEQRPRRIESFLASLVVPGLMADEVPGWTPPEHLSPHVVLAHLACLEGAPAPDRRDKREREIVYRRVAGAGKVPSDPSISEAFEVA